VNSYRLFPRAVKKQIIARATIDGRVTCERCGAWCKTRKDFEIDHVIAERMRPEADKKRNLRAADGQLLCTAVCHRAKTAKDKGFIAEAKRREARHPVVTAGKTSIQRRFGL